MIFTLLHGLSYLIRSFKGLKVAILTLQVRISVLELTIFHLPAYFFLVKFDQFLILHQRFKEI
jgi:hypothetical protein